MSEKKFEYKLGYLTRAYNKNYNRGDLDKAKIYDNIAQKIHGVSLEVNYHNRLAASEKRKGPYGIGSTRKLRYG
jgi:hypothetical protein